MQRALTLAESEGYLRIFLDEGPALAAILKTAAEHDIAPEYARRLLAAQNTAHNKSDNAADDAHSGQGLLEPLSARELDVLRLLRSDLNGPDIARELFVSLNTVEATPRTSTPSWG